MERDGENKVANETGEAMMVRRGSGWGGAREGETRLIVCQITVKRSASGLSSVPLI